MAFTKDRKSGIITDYRTHDTDTGSPEVQVALLTEEIKRVTKHLKTHKKDISSRRGLLQMVNKRRRLLNYLTKESEERYQKLIKVLKLKR